ncbi:MAG: hypothetical protein GEU95_08880 [Rhizobiales bacterium]|nr:hypothetical protein [Hyphomicrobiales bacterium]
MMGWFGAQRRLPTSPAIGEPADSIQIDIGLAERWGMRVERWVSRAAQHHWHHSIDLGHGVVTKGSKPPDLLAAEAEIIFDRVDIGGCSVLDVGAWNGFFSFEANPSFTVRRKKRIRSMGAP